jgi:beta-N-acetylhexosaminidase
MKLAPYHEISELLLLRLAGPQWSTSLERELRELSPGGVLLASPLPHSPDTLHDLLSRITKSLPTPPILAIEEEGGAQGPLSALLPPIPPPRSLGRRSPCYARQAGQLIGEALRLLGFSANFTPPLNVAPNLDAEESSVCAYSTDPRAVGERGYLFIEGLSRHKIMACGKHFPGVGGVLPRNPRELPVSKRSMAELWGGDLIPYRRVLSDLPFVMMSTTAYKAYDYEYPCSAVFSTRIVQGLLRTKLGYSGVVIAPRLECESVRGALEISLAAAQSIEAGCDMLLLHRRESWRAMRRGIACAIESGHLGSERLEQAAMHIGAVKKRLAWLQETFSKTDWDRLARRFEEFGSGA